jgi:hypothetical protein
VASNLIGRDLTIGSADNAASRIAVIRAIVLAGLIVAFLILQAFSLRPRLSDEGLYLYVADRISQGAVPYRDFFLAHPPVRFLFMAVACAVAADVPVLLLLSFSPLAAAGTALALSAIARRCPLRGTAARETAGFVAPAAFLFCEFTLRGAGYALGVFEATLLVVIGAMLLVTARPVFAGAACALGLMTALPVAPLVVSVAAWAALRGQARRFFVSVATTFLGMHVLLAAFCGFAWVEQMYLFHLAKHGNPTTVHLALATFFREAGGLLGLSLAAIACLLLQPGPMRKASALAAGSLMACLVSAASRPTAFWYYLVPAVAPAALVAGLGVGWAIQQAQLASRAVGPHARRLLFVGVGLAGVALIQIAAVLFEGIWPRPAQESQRYRDASWTDAPLLGPLNGLVKAALWTEHPHDEGNPLTRYLRLSMEQLDLAPALGLVRQLASRDERLTLFGDPRVVPYLALFSHRRVTEDLADVNDQRFAGGQIRADDVLAVLARASAPVVVLAEHRQMLPWAVESHVRREFVLVGVFESGRGRRHEIYARLARTAP